LVKSEDSRIILSSFLTFSNACEYIEIVALITAPDSALKKCVRSEPPPPKLTLTGDFDLTYILSSLFVGK